MKTDLTDQSQPQSGPRARLIAVTDDEAGLRLDRWFRRHFAELQHSALQKLLRTGQVRVDGKRAEASDRLLAGQQVRVPPQIESGQGGGAHGAVSERTMERLRAMILFEDDDVLVLNKPAGLAVQGGTGLKENLDDMLAAWGGGTRPKLVHRLDRATSGVLLVARTDFAAAKLAESFRERETRKIYWALTVGVPDPAQGRIDVALVKQGDGVCVAGPQDRDEAKDAETLYKVMEKAHKLAAFVALWPITGRTHQLRVHLAHSGTPIFGDAMYGDPTRVTNLPEHEMGTGLHLHARRLMIPHPRRGTIDVSAPLSKAMQKTWSWFGFDEKARANFDGI